MISILLAAYNGEQYIKAQIESILHQTVQDFVLYINDDCSEDRTWEILKDYAGQYPGKIVAARNPKNSGSSKANFLNMILEHRDDYLMLCDQDDVWLPEKIEKTMAKMREMELLYGPDTPLLVYTDLKVTDRNLNILADSMMKRVAADFNRTSLRDQLVQNTVTGCTVMYNRALADKFIKLPGFTVMHDWWMMLTASALGYAGYLEEATILYRQHGDNSIGTRDMRSIGFLARFMLRGNLIRKALDETYVQAEALYKEFGTQMGTKNAMLVKAYAGIRKQFKLKRILTFMKLGTWKHGIVRIIGQIIYC